MSVRNFIHRWLGPPNDRADLTENWDFIFVLLDDTRAWKQRLVERVRFQAAHHVHVESAYQCELPRAMLAGRVSDDANSAEVLLPVTTREKRPLLNLDVRHSSGQPAHLLPRASIAAIEGEYLWRLLALWDHGGGVRASIPSDLFEAVCVTSPDVFRSFVAQRGSEAEALADYLTGGLGFSIDPVDVEGWLAITRAAAAQLVAVLNEPAEPLFSTSENFLLSLPRLENRPATLAAVAAVVRAYSTMIARAAQLAAADRDAHDFLSVLGEYGRRWEVIVDVEIPLREPSVITLVEDRPLVLERGSAVHRFSLGDAKSARLDASVGHHTVSFRQGHLGVVTLDGAKVGVGPIGPHGGAVGPLELAQDTKELISIYSSEPERPDRVEVLLPLVLSNDVSRPGGLLFGLTLAAIAMTAFVSSTELTDKLAVLVVPSTLAVALTLIREESPLAARLSRRRNAWLAGAVVALWLVTAVRLIAAGTDLGWLPFV
ncbi:MAG TPA: hypothetical protein VN238_01325 [Solirubrobacteraceae bacterium]|nr:hypothetical protein [Solirubrobacteraceae bacterium]